MGFEDDEALLPVTERSFHGYRLLAEYFCFPQRYRFFELERAVARDQGARHRRDRDRHPAGAWRAGLESVVDASNFALFCTPAVNLFPKRADRIHISEGAYEYHVVPDRTRPMDFEVYEVTGVVGHGVGSHSEQDFLPLYSRVQHRGRPAAVRVLHDAARAARSTRRRRSAAGRVRAT